MQQGAQAQRSLGSALQLMDLWGRNIPESTDKMALHSLSTASTGRAPLAAVTQTWVSGLETSLLCITAAHLLPSAGPWAVGEHPKASQVRMGGFSSRAEVFYRECTTRG